MYLKNNQKSYLEFQNYLLGNNTDATQACGFLEVTGDTFLLDKN